jgi:hypothetical protein
MCISRAELRLTHVGGTSNGVLAFAELYSALGNYVAWQALVSGDPEKGAAPCIEFESAMVQGAGYYWLAHPRANTNAKLVGFVDRVLEHHALHDVRPARCREVIVYAPRRGMCRAVRNSDAVVQTIRAAAPRHEVVARDLATMGILQQIELVREWLPAHALPAVGPACFPSTAVRGPPRGSMQVLPPVRRCGRPPPISSCTAAPGPMLFGCRQAQWSSRCAAACLPTSSPTAPAAASVADLICKP